MGGICFAPAASYSRRFHRFFRGQTSTLTSRGGETGGVNHCRYRPEADSTECAKEHTLYRHDGADSDKGRTEGENLRIKCELDRGQ